MAESPSPHFWDAVSLCEFANLAVTEANFRTFWARRPARNAPLPAHRLGLRMVTRPRVLPTVRRRGGAPVRNTSQRSFVIPLDWKSYVVVGSQERIPDEALQSAAARKSFLSLQLEARLRLDAMAATRTLWRKDAEARGLRLEYFDRVRSHRPPKFEDLERGLSRLPTGRARTRRVREIYEEVRCLPREWPRRVRDGKRVSFKVFKKVHDLVRGRLGAIAENGDLEPLWRDLCAAGGQGVHLQALHVPSAPFMTSSTTMTASTTLFFFGQFVPSRAFEEYVDQLFVHTAIDDLWPLMWRCASCLRFGVSRIHKPSPHYCSDACRYEHHGQRRTDRRRADREALRARVAARMRELVAAGAGAFQQLQARSRVAREMKLSERQIERLLS